MAKSWTTLLRARRRHPGPSPSFSTNSEIETETPSTSEPPVSVQAHEPAYPSGLKLTLILTSLMMSMFLVALDRLIIATAIPRITDDFHSAADVGWYASSFLLTNAAFQLAFGKLYTFWTIKRVFLASVLLFEAGSAVCGAAGGSAVFIFGRALSGVGGAGIFSGAVVILVHCVPLRRRPMFQGLFGATFGTASVVGPLLGGAFTTHVTWRWCFYINLPLGGIAMLIVAFLLDVPERQEHTQIETSVEPEMAAGTEIPRTRSSSWRKLRQLDFAGTSVFLPGIVCFLLALQWGGIDHPWNSAVIIALLVLAAVLLAAFVAIQTLLPETATVPPRVLSGRTMISAFLVIFCIGSHMMIFVYFLPIWFQAIQGSTAVSSGTKTLPLVLSLVIATSASGALVSRLGPYLPPLHTGTLLATAGAALLTTLRPDSPAAHWVGYQVAYGLGLGLCFQVPNVAVQTVLRAADVPIGTALVFFAQLLGGAVFVSVGQTVLASELKQRLAGVEGVGVRVKGSGVTTLVAGLEGEARAAVVAAYNEALRRTFLVGLAMAGCAVLAGSFMEWRSVKEEKEGGQVRMNEHVGERAGVAAADSPPVGGELRKGPEKSPEREAVKETEQGTETETEKETDTKTRKETETETKKETETETEKETQKEAENGT